MNKFEKIWDTALDELRESLAQSGITESDVTRIIDLLEDVNFPAALSILASGEKDDSRQLLEEDFLNAIAAQAAEQDVLKARGIDADGVKSILSKIFIRRMSPQAVLDDDALLNTILEQATEQLAKEGSVVTPGEARRIRHLLSSGEFFGDIASSTAVVVQTVPKLPIALVRDIRRASPFALIKFPLIVAQDLIGLPVQAPGVIADLLDGSLDNPPALMTNTLGYLYKKATLKTTAEMIRTLIRPENETVRLALILYARLNGFPLDQQHLDLLSENVFATDTPDLGPLLAAAIPLLKERYPQPELEKILRATTL